jgi:hypothetical protein
LKSVVVEPNGQAARAGQNQDPAPPDDDDRLLFSDKLSACHYLIHTIKNSKKLKDWILLPISNS